MSNYVNLMDIVYPVGSIYISMNSTSPAEIIGGTWMQIVDKFLRPSDSALQDVGSNSHYHTMNADVAGAMVDFWRSGNWLNIYYTASSTNAGINQESGKYTYSQAICGTNPVGASSRKNDASFPIEVKGRTHSNSDYIPLSTTCYCWYRIA